jgi:tetratricopeptide (TPR) repeat protein
LSRFRRLRAIGWPGVRRTLRLEGSSRGLYALGLSSGLVLLALIPVGIAQSSRRPAPPPPGLQAAARALIEGKYDDVAGLTAKLDQQDPSVAAVNGRALIARGKYQEAEALLRPIAGRAPASDAALELGLLLHMLGRPEAAAILSKVGAAASVSNDAQELGRAARALQALRHQARDVAQATEDAHATFRDAVSLAPKDPALNTAWGELFLETYNNGEALKSFQDALAADPRHEPALVGIALAIADEDPPKANAAALKALEINPSDIRALAFLAEQAIDNGKRDDARKVLEKALTVNPVSLEALSLVAALDYLEDKTADFQATVAKVQAIAPGYGEVYRVAADVTARAYRFDEAVTLVREALKLRPAESQALGDFGLYLLRTADEPGARQALEASFKLDPYDRVTYNLLQMMDTLDTFVTVQDNDIVLKLAKDEAPVLQEFALSLAHRALDTLSKRYQFTPKAPTLIEIFTKHDDFAVRSIGLPGMVYALGACFGRVVTMDSPRARPGEFQWEATLWHELAHVITLQMSNNRLPRWVSEGISTYEEGLARPEWGRGQDVQFAGMLNTEGVIKLKDLNASLSNPRLASIGYFQAGLVIEHLVKTFGDQGLHRLLLAYGKGLDETAALKEALNTDYDSLQTGFDALLESRFGAMRRALKAPEGVELFKTSVEELLVLAAKNPDSYPVHLVLARRLREAGKTDEALKVLERAATLVPLANGDDSPHAQIAEIALERKDQARAIAALEAVVKTDFDNVQAARELAAAMRDAGITDPARTAPVYQRIVAIDPFDAGSHATLGRLALQRNDADLAIREFRAVLALKPVDQAAAHTDLAEAYLRGGRRPDARKQTLAALEIAPGYERAQDLLLKLSEARQ